MWAAVAGRLISTVPPKLAGRGVATCAAGAAGGAGVDAMREEIPGAVAADHDSSANNAAVVASVVVALPAAVGVE